MDGISDTAVILFTRDFKQEASLRCGQAVGTDFQSILPAISAWRQGYSIQWKRYIFCNSGQ